MLAIITGQAARCALRAQRCRRRADRCPPEMRRDYVEQAERWERLAESYRFAERVSAYLDWSSELVRLRPGAYE